MKKEIRKKAIIIGVVIGMLILCAIPILIHMSSKQVAKIGKLDEPETKQYSTEPTVGSESELNDFTYTKDDTAKTVTLTRYNNTTNTSLTIHNKYSVGGIAYSTIVKPYLSGGSSYLIKDNVTTLIFEDGVEVEATTMLSDTKVKNVDMGKAKIVGTTMEWMFSGCSNLTSIKMDGLDTSNITDMQGLFNGCSALTNIDLSALNTINVTNMYYMFANCSSLTSINLSVLNTSKLENMKQMFYNCSALTSIDLSNLDLSRVTNREWMFDECSEVETINLSNAILPVDSSYMFSYNNFTKLTSINLSNTNTTNVTTMRSMFKGCSSLANIDLSDFNTSNVTSMRAMFDGCSALENLDLTDLDMSNVTDIAYMFDGCNALESIDLSNLDLSKITNIYNQFNGLKSLISVNMSGVDMSNITNVYNMFHNCSALTSVDLSNIKISKLTSVDNMFGNNISLASVDLNNVDLSNITDIYDIGLYTIETINLSNSIMPSNLSDKNKSMFTGNKSLKTVNMTNTDFSNTTNMARLFYECSALTQIEGINTWDTRNVTNMLQMFDGCSNLNDINVSKFDTSNVTNMGGMFSYCSALTNLDISSFDMTNVTNYGSMFDNCNFDTLVTPKVGQTSTTLPYTMYDETGTSYTALPTTSKILYKESPIKTYTVTFVNEGTTVDTQIVEEGQGATAPVLTKAGYVLRWDKEFSNITSDITVNAKWLKDTDGDGIPDIEDDDTQVRYIVEHYVQNTDLTTYTLQETDTTLTGNLGHEVTATPKTYTGFSVVETDNTVASGTVVDDGSLVLKLYYNRNTYKLPLNVDGEIEEIEYVYGEEITLPTDKEKEGYTFEGWYDNGYLTGEPVEKIDTSKIDPENPPTYYIKWTINTYIVTFMNGEETAKTEEVEYGSSATAPVLTKAGYVLRWDKEFSNITNDITVNAVWLKDTDGDGIPDIEDDDTQVRYTVEHYVQNIDLATYTLQETENTLTGNLGSTVTATPKTYTGFSVAEIDETVASGIVVDDGSLVLKLYYNRNTYKLPLNVDGEIEEIEYVYGEEITLPTDKEKEGYTFEGWYDNEALAGAPVEKVDTSKIDPENPSTYYIKWTANTYTVTLNKNEGTINSGDVTNYTYGIGVALPTNVTKQGYVFRGWYEDEACEGTAVTTIGVTETGAKVYYAKWLKDTDGDGIPDIEDDDTQVRYTVEHYVQNIDLATYTLQETENTLTGNLGHEVTATPKTYTGFSVVETDETVASGTVVDDGSLVLKLYYNRNNYTVTLNKNEGTINSGDVTSYTYGIGVALPTNVTKQGYVFRGWYEDEACEGTAVTTIGVTETGAKVYYAKWLKDTDGDGIPDIEDDDTQVRYTVEHYVQNIDLTTYTLQETENTLTGNLGTTVTATPKTYTGFSVVETDETVASGTVVDDGSLVLKLYYNRNTYKLPLNVDGEIEEIEYVYGEEITLPTDKEKEGYTFEGWYDNEDLTGAPVEKVDTSELDPENPPTYYIKWTANEGIAYTVKHYKQEGNTNTYTLADTEELTGTTGETVIARPKTYEGYVENTTVSERIPSGVVKGDGSLELVLIYDTIKLTVTFKDGDTTVDTQTIVYGENAVAPTPTKEGYILRWDKEFNNVKTNLTVNAVWLKDTDGDGIPDIEDDDTQVRYTVEHYVQNTDLTTYTLQETENTLTGNLGSTVNATPKTYTGFTLTQTDSTIANGTVVDDGSLVLKLYYNRNNYAVTLNKNEGTINSGNVLQYTYGIGVALPTNVTKEGYVFRGWYDNANLTGTAVTTIGVTETGAKIYYAKWLKDTDGDGIPDIEDDDTQVRYTVEHYKQNLAQNGYDEAEIENLQGQLGSIVTAQAKTYTGFSVAVTDETVPSGTVVDDGSLVLKLYYDRENYEITYETNGGTIEDDNYVTSYTYGIVVSLPLNVTKEGFTFGGWYENIVEEGARAYTRSVEEKTIVSQTKETDTGAKIYYANWNANGNTAYKVEHYKQGETGYILADTDNLTAETGVTVTAVPKTYEGYEENINHEERISEGTVAGNGSLVLKLYYDMLTYEVTFKDGETVLSTQTINYGENAVAPSLAKEGYILRWDKEYNNVTSNLTVNAIWLKDTDGDGIPDIEDDETLVEYIVRHYKQQGNTNTYELVDTETLQGNLGSTVTATPKVYEGYEENITAIERIPSGKITGEETLELRLFYSTMKYEVIFKDGEKEVGRVVVPHGGTAEPPILTKEGYTLSWDKDLRNITENQTINAVWTKVEDKQQTYKVEHYVETKEGKYSLKETQNLVGNIGEAVTASPKTYEEYVLDETNKNTVKTGEIKEGSELTLKLYYNYKKYEVIFKDGEEEVGRVEVIHGEKAEPPELTKPGYILSWDKNINNITKEQTITAVWTVDPNHKDPNAGKDDNKPDNDNPTIDKLPDDGKEEKPSILPKTGEEVVTIGAVIGLLGVAVAYFVKYKF